MAPGLGSPARSLQGREQQAHTQQLHLTPARSSPKHLPRCVHKPHTALPQPVPREPQAEIILSGINSSQSQSTHETDSHTGCPCALPRTPRQHSLESGGPLPPWESGDKEKSVQSRAAGPGLLLPTKPPLLPLFWETVLPWTVDSHLKKKGKVFLVAHGQQSIPSQA